MTDMTDQLGLPPSDIDPVLKSQKDYVLKKCEAIYGMYKMDKCLIPYSKKQIMQDLRAYGQGRQDENKYKSHYLLEDVDTGRIKVTERGIDTTSLESRRKGWMNVSWDIVSVAPKISAYLHSKIEQVDYNIQADLIDSDSGAEKEAVKWEKFAKAQNKPFIDQAYMAMGLQPDNSEMLPNDLQELELFEMLGGFKPAVSRAYEKILQHTYDISDWPDVKSRLIDDFRDFNMAALVDYYDEDTHKMKTKYADIKDLIIQYSEEDDFKDISFWGHIEHVSIYKIRAKLESEGYTEDQIRSIAFSYSDNFGNPSQAEWQNYDRIGMYGKWLYDNYKVPVMRCEYVELDGRHEKINISRRGTRTVRDLPYGKVVNTENSKTRVTRVQQLYEASFIVGSQMVFDYGICKNISRNSKKRVNMSLHVQRIKDKSITETLRPVYDGIQHGWLRFQNSLSMIWEEGYAVDMNMLGKVTMGGKDYDILQVIEMWRKTGILPFKSLGFKGKYEGGAVVPVHRLPGGMGERLNESIGMFAHFMNMIEMLTGISPVALGSLTTTETSATEVQQVSDAALNIVKPIITKVFRLKEQSSHNLARKAQLYIRNVEDCREAYRMVVGDNDVEAMQNTEKVYEELGIKLIPRATDFERQALLAAAEKSLEAGRNGMPGITMSDYTFILYQIAANANLDELRLYLSYREKKSREAIQAEKERASTLQYQSLAQIEQMKLKVAQQNKLIEVQGQISIDKNKGDEERKTLMAKQNADYMAKLQEIALAEENEGIATTGVNK